MELDHDHFGVHPLDIDDVPIDLRPRPIRGGSYRPDDVGGGSGFSQAMYRGDPIARSIARDIRSIASTQIINRGLIGRSILVGSSPVPIVEAREGRGYLILNPTQAGGTSTVSGVLASSITIDDTLTYPVVLTQVGCEAFNQIAFFLGLSNIVGSPDFDFVLQSNGLLTGFIDAVTVFNVTASSPATVYNKVETNGIDETFRIAIYSNAAPPFSVTFDLSYVMKGAGGISTSGSTVFIGGPGVSSESGYPILPGVEKSFFIKENVSLYAVTAVGASPISVKVFEI
ncbi:MAG: hypothetical protein QW514_10290 [Thermoprotei archaeon]